MSEVVNIPQLRFPGFSGEWKDKRFDSLYPTVRNGFVGVATPYYVEEGVPYLQGKNIKSGAINKNGLVYINEYFHQKSKKSQLRKNDIVMVQSGHVGECAVITEEFEDTNCHALLVSTPTHDIDSKFYINYFYSKFGRKKIHRITTGNTIKHILSSDLKIQIVSNPSYQEQQKIAAFLTAVDNKIEQLSKKKELLGEYKKGLMQQIFSQAIRFKADDGSAFPDWEEKKLGDVGNFYRGHSYNSTNVKDSGLLVLRSSNIKNDSLILDNDLQFVNKDCSDNISLKTNDIVICMANGSKRLVGKSGIYHGDYNGKLTVGAFCSIFRTDNLLSKYILQTVQYRKYLHILLAGTNINNLKNSELSELTFNLPVSSFEQTKIASFLSSIDNKIEQVDKQLDESKQFKKALLQQMFV